MRWKIVVLVVLATVVLASVFVVGFIFGGSRVSNPRAGESLPPAISAADGEQIIKEKLENYSKRADDLQKLISLLLTLTTIYTVALAASAYASVQNNLQQADKGINRLDNLVREQQSIIDKNSEVLSKQLADMDLSVKFATRIAVASMFSQFPPKEDDYEEIQQSAIKNLSEFMELGGGKYATEVALNQQLARLYVALKRYRNAEQVMTEFIRRKRRLGQGDDPAIVDAYYDRACYQSMRWSSPNEDKNLLAVGIKRDLSYVFGRDDTLRAYAQKDKELENVASQDWFVNLIRG